MSSWRLTFELGGLIASGLLITQTSDHFGEHLRRLSETKNFVATLEDPRHTPADVKMIETILQPAAGQDLLELAHQQKAAAQEAMNDDGFSLDSGLIIGSIAGISLYMHATRTQD